MEKHYKYKIWVSNTLIFNGTQKKKADEELIEAANTFPEEPLSCNWD